MNPAPSSSPGPRVLGIDPGLQVTGYAVLEARAGIPRVCEAGVIRSAEGATTTDMAQRVRILYDGIVEVLEQFQPGVVVVEQLFAHYEHPRTAILMAHARGVMFLAAGQRGLPVSVTTPRASRRPSPATAALPRSRCSGPSSANWDWLRLPEPPDVADALAAALCHYYVHKLPAGEPGASATGEVS